MQPREQFIAWMAARFNERADAPMDEAIKYAAQVLDGADGPAWGDPDFDQTEEGAREMADTDMDYWE
jgi:hypothetical protein